MSNDDELFERRASDRRRLDAVDARLGNAERKIVAHEERLTMIVLTINSRHEASAAAEQELKRQIEELRAFKDKVFGAWGLFLALVSMGIIGGAISIVKLLKGP